MTDSNDGVRAAGLGLFVVLQIADVITTNLALSLAGNWEVNPVIASLMAKAGGGWWVFVKLPLIGVAVLAAQFIPARLFASLIASYALLVTNNYLHCIRY